MPIISAKIITPRKIRYCGSYAHSGDDLMPVGVPQMRLYGNGRSGDPKYTMYICLDCAAKSVDQKIIETLSAHNKTAASELRVGGSMAKLIPIFNCHRCIYRMTTNCRDHYCGKMDRRKLAHNIHLGFPDWCPLPDSPPTSVIKPTGETRRLMPDVG